MSRAAKYRESNTTTSNRFAWIDCSVPRTNKNVEYAKLYEDVSKGLLPEKRFQMLADCYDTEQAGLTEKIEQYEREGRAEHDQLDKILVSKAEKVDGEYVQKIQFFYRLLYNKPSEYAQLVLGGEVEHYPSLSYDNSKLED